MRHSPFHPVRDAERGLIYTSAHPLQARHLSAPTIPDGYAPTTHYLAAEREAPMWA